MEITPKRMINSRSGYGDKVLEEHYGQAYVNYRAKWNDVSLAKEVTEFPLYLQFELNPYCNLRCVSCIHGHETLRKDYIGQCGTLSEELYLKVLGEAAVYGCPSISFHNNSEPLLDQNLLTRIKQAREHGFIDIILVTNGYLMTPAISDQLLESGVTKITFSIDGFTKETYMKNRPNSDYDLVHNNVHYFLSEKLKRKLPLPITRVSFVVNRNSIHEMSDFEDYWKDKVDLVDFQNFSVLKGFTENLVPEGFEPIKDFMCVSPYQQVVIRGNGDVLPCCSLYGPNIVLGNIGDSTVHEIWHSKQMNHLRQDLKAANFSNENCRKCKETFYVKLEE